jgi:hypothetical protein
MALTELQTVDDEIREFKTQRDELTTNLEALKGILAGMSSELEDKREKLTEANRVYTEQQEELRADGERMSRAKQKLATVTRTKEYAAMQRELDNIRKKYSEDEAELKRLGEAMEEYKAAIATQEEKLDALQAEVTREEAANTERMGYLTGQIEAVDGRRGAISTKIDDRTCRRYERILQRRDGRAVVAAENGKCTGCQMRLPPQLFILVQRLETLESCPACQRFLFFVPAEEA